MSSCHARALSLLTVLPLLMVACGDGGSGPGEDEVDVYPACLTPFERELATIINAERADSGRAALEVDTRLVQAARHTAAERAAGNATFFDFGAAYGYTGTAGTAGIGAFTAAGFWTAIRTQPDQEVARASALSASSRHLGVGTLETSPGTTEAIAFLVGTRSGATVTDGSCIP